MVTPSRLHRLFGIALSCWIAAPFPALAAGRAEGSTPGAHAKAHKPDKPKPHKHCGSFRRPCQAAPIVPTLLATEATTSSPAIAKAARIASNLGSDTAPLALTVTDNSLVPGTSVTLEPFLTDTASPNPVCGDFSGTSFAGSTRRQLWQSSPDAYGGATIWSGLGSSTALSVDLTQPSPYPVVTDPSQLPADSQAANTSRFQSWSYDATSQTLANGSASGTLYAPAAGAAVEIANASGPGSGWYPWPSYPLDQILTQAPVGFPTGCDSAGNCDAGEQQAYDYITTALALDDTTTCTLGSQSNMKGIRCQYTNLHVALGGYHTDMLGLKSCQTAAPSSCPDTTQADWDNVVTQLDKELTAVGNVRALYLSFRLYFNEIFLSDSLTISSIATDAGISQDSTVNAAAVSFVRGVTYTVVESIPGAAALGNLMEALGNTAAAAEDTTLTTAYVRTVAQIDAALATAYGDILTAVDAQSTEIQSDWGRLSAVSLLTTKLNGPDSLAWPTVDPTNPRESVRKVSSAAFTIAAMQVLLPVQYSVRRFVGQVDDSLAGTLCDGQWAEQVGTQTNGDELWNKFAIVDNRNNPPSPDAIDDVVQNGASLHDVFNGLNGWTSLSVADANPNYPCNMSSIVVTNATSHEMTLNAVPEEDSPNAGFVAVLGGNDEPLTVSTGDLYQGTTSTVSIRVPPYGSTTLYAGNANDLLGSDGSLALDVSIEDECGTILSYVHRQDVCDFLGANEASADTFEQSSGCQGGIYPYGSIVTDPNYDSDTPGAVEITLYDPTLPPPPAPPVISFVEPFSGHQGDTALAVRIQGNNFDPGATVDFGSGITESCQHDSLVFDCTVAIDLTRPIGELLITVTNPDGLVGTYPWSVLGAIPYIQAPLSPDSGFADTSLAVTITGSSFVSGATCDFGPDITVSSCSVDSATRVTANIAISPAAAPGPRQFTLTDPDGNSVTATFTVVGLAPVVSVFRPGGAAAGDTLAVAIYGANFQPGATCDFGPDISSSPCSGGASRLTATITIAADGKYGLFHPHFITVTNPDGQSGSSPLSFGVGGVGTPSVYDFAPKVVHQGESLSVTFTGTDFAAPASCVPLFECSFDGTCPGPAGVPPIAVNSCTVDSPTQATAAITVPPDATPGVWVWGLRIGGRLALGSATFVVLP